MIATHRVPILAIPAILVISSMFGCGGALRARPVSGPVAVGASAGDTSGDKRPATLRAAFKGRLETGEERHRFEGTLALSAPDRLLVEIAGALGGVRAVMTVKEERVIVLFPGTREYLDEEEGAAACEALLGLRLDPRSLIDLIQFGAGSGCTEETCTRRIPLAAGPGDAPSGLTVTRRGVTVTARPDTADGDPAGFRRLELRLVEADSSGAGEIADDLFEPRIPDGWRRLRLGPGRSHEPLLLPR